MKTHFYIIQALTNIHVGSGDANFGVIDNLIQRDPVTELPAVHGSSLKGALREYFESQNNINIEEIFGSNDNSGNYKFLAAQMLAIPVRSNKKPYFMATSHSVIKEFKKLAESMGGKIPKALESLTSFEPSEDETFVFCDTHNLIIEDFSAFQRQNFEQINDLNKYLGVEENNLVIFNDNDFKRICSDANLPVIARNKLENGKSQNLWYEQVIPRESRLWTVIISPDDDNHFEEFNKKLTDPKSIIPIGANASVGYGFTKFIELV